MKPTIALGVILVTLALGAPPKTPDVVPSDTLIAPTPTLAGHIEVRPEPDQLARVEREPRHTAATVAPLPIPEVTPDATGKPVLPNMPEPRVYQERGCNGTSCTVNWYAEYAGHGRYRWIAERKAWGDWQPARKALKVKPLAHHRTTGGVQPAGDPSPACAHVAAGRASVERHPVARVATAPVRAIVRRARR